MCGREQEEEKEQEERKEQEENRRKRMNKVEIFLFGFLDIVKV